jgi:hypothetical protein
MSMPKTTMGTEIADRLAKEAPQIHHITYSRILKCAIKKILGKKVLYKKMAELLGGNKERSDY